MWVSMNGNISICSRIKTNEMCKYEIDMNRCVVKYVSANKTLFLKYKYRAYSKGI